MEPHHIFNVRERLTIMLTVIIVTPDIHTGYLGLDLLLFFIACQPVGMIVTIMALMLKFRQPPF